MSHPVPKSVLIVGSGVFGLSTAYSLATNETFKDTKITVVDRSEFPAPDGSSIDTSRIIRSDYGDIAHAQFALEAQEKWRREWWGEGVYFEAGLALVTETNNDSEGASGSDPDLSYMRRSLENGKKLGLSVGDKASGADLEVLPNRASIESIIKQPDDSTGGSGGTDCGYVNWRAGWADAEGGMRNLRKKLVSMNRITFVKAQVRRLLFTPSASNTSHTVSGVTLTDSSTLQADLTILATGAWTPSLIDLRGLASATGQVLTYLPINDSEQATLSQNPTLLNESTGLFIIPPSHNLLKVARHGYGYANPRTIPNPEPAPLTPGASASSHQPHITVSLPSTTYDNALPPIPQEGIDSCRDFLVKSFPSLSERTFTHGRICWYTDTRTGDWIIDHHPRYEGLFVATGGSGHAYKFLPVVGDKIVDCILGRREGELGERWRWPSHKGKEDHVWTDDWRGGVKGLDLGEELAKGEAVFERT